MLDWFYGGGGLKPSFPVCVGHRLCGLFEGWWVCGVGVGVDDVNDWFLVRIENENGSVQNLEPAPEFFDVKTIDINYRYQLSTNLGG